MQRTFRIAFVEKDSKDLLCLLLDDCLTVSRLVAEVCSCFEARLCVFTKIAFPVCVYQAPGGPLCRYEPQEGGKRTYC